MKFAKSLEDFQRIADICGYKRGWAWHKWNDFKANKKSLQNSRHAC